MFDDGEDSCDEEEFDDEEIDDEEIDDLLNEMEDLQKELEDLLVEFNGLNEESDGGNGSDDGIDEEDEEIDYGSGEIVASSGNPLDSPDNASGKRFRLPDDHTAPGIVLNTDVVSGGWGYTIWNATVIKGGISNENVFIEDRVLEELARWEESTGEKFAFTGYQRYAQELVRDGSQFYDLLFVQIEIVPQADWDQLEEDWKAHDEYKNDKKGRRKHEKWQNSKTIRFTELFWFNINDFFSFDEDEDSGLPEIEE